MDLDGNSAVSGVQLHQTAGGHGIAVVTGIVVDDGEGGCGAVGVRFHEDTEDRVGHVHLVGVRARGEPDLPLAC